jgi:SNF2 family DNA or RNA helicase
MGLGKTVQALALLLSRASLGPALVVAPTSVCGNWQREAWRFGPSLQVHMLRAGDAASLPDPLGQNDLVVCSYGVLVSRIDPLADTRWATLVLDEAQAFKNHKTQRYEAVARLAADARLALTGTPIENHVGELWSQFSVLNPGLLSEHKHFAKQFGTPIANADRKALTTLRRLVLPYILRRTKSEVLDELPSRTETTVTVDLSPPEASLYEALRRKAAESLQDDSSPVVVLAELTRLRLACCHPSLALPKDAAAGAIGGAKLEAFLELVDEMAGSGHRALVFSQFVKHLTLIRKALDDRGIGYLYLDGSTPAKQRDKRVSAFQAGQTNLFLISLKAGGTGLNLTGADSVIHMDPWWNPAVEDQASDRAHRIGQTRPVTIYRLVTAGTIEEQIVALHHRKRDLAGKLLSGTDAAGRLSTAELLALIQTGHVS